ncbi:zinc finger protein 112-like [Condylostylus longicornis]|uniref:zinc finger protein 112-like n=1 Tax=Condylostylus longicornis TaxID=2530218 RepID=UPI00244DB1CA|nr:zinc finger protein 112-like [Condylostylus longicornis]
MEINLNGLWEKNCLICLQESEFKMIPILENKDSDSHILEKVVKCTNFKTAELKERTLYPSNVCKKCYFDLNVAYKLITLSEHSKNKLENLNKKLQKYANDELLRIADDTIGVCKKCTDSENITKVEEEDNADNFIIYEEHIASDFENENSSVNDNIEETKNVKFKITKKLENKNIFEESKQRALERINKEKFQKSICDLCGNYYSQSHLKYHRMRHDKVKRFECEICKRRFATETDLRRHMRVHTGEKPYACKYCDRKFSDYGSRIKHERCHTGERPYTCQTCNKSFMYSHALKKHQSVHTGYKAFTCEICNTGFTKKEYLQNHVKKHNVEEIQNGIIILEQSPVEASDATTFYFGLAKNSENTGSKLKIKAEN